MQMFLTIVVAGLFIVMLFRLWPMVKERQQNGPKAQQGDWLAVALPLGGVVLLVLLLVLMVR